GGVGLDQRAGVHGDPVAEKAAPVGDLLGVNVLVGGAVVVDVGDHAEAVGSHGQRGGVLGAGTVGDDERGPGSGPVLAPAVHVRVGRVGGAVVGDHHIAAVGHGHRGFVLVIDAGGRRGRAGDLLAGGGEALHQHVRVVPGVVVVAVRPGDGELAAGV